MRSSVQVAKLTQKRNQKQNGEIDVDENIKSDKGYQDESGLSNDACAVVVKVDSTIDQTGEPFFFFVFLGEDHMRQGVEGCYLQDKVHNDDYDVNSLVSSSRSALAAFNPWALYCACKAYPSCRMN